MEHTIADKGQGGHFCRLRPGRRSDRCTLKKDYYQDILPNFRQDLYYEGILAGVRSIKAVAIGEYNTERAGADDSPVGLIGVLTILFLFVFVVIIVLIAKSAKRTHKYGRK